MPSIAPYVASCVGFVLGFFMLPFMFAGVRVHNVQLAVRLVGIGGLVSALGSKLITALLALVFLPIVLAGPLGAFAVLVAVNAGLLLAGWQWYPVLWFERARTVGYASIALSVLQTLVTHLVPATPAMC